MAVIYNLNETKQRLIEIAAENNIEVDEEMTKKQIIALFDECNECDNIEENVEQDDTEKLSEQVSVGEGQLSMEESDTGVSTTQSDVGSTDDTDEYTMFAYAGPSLPNGRLKECAVFRGTLKDVMKYLKAVLEDYPQVAKLIVPVHRLGAFLTRVRTPGNAVHKYYNDIVSTMHNHKEV